MRGIAATTSRAGTGPPASWPRPPPDGTLDAGFAAVEVRTQLAPAWTTDWITVADRRKLVAAGIAAPPPTGPRTGPVPLRLGPTPAAVECPRCGARNAVRTADFGSTACKALYRCRSCDEPFEYVKPVESSGSR